MYSIDHNNSSIVSLKEQILGYFNNSICELTYSAFTNRPVCVIVTELKIITNNMLYWTFNKMGDNVAQWVRVKCGVIVIGLEGVSFRFPNIYLCAGVDISQILTNHQDKGRFYLVSKDDAIPILWFLRLIPMQKQFND